MKKKKVVAYTYLILGLILCLIFASRFLPFNSYGAEDTKIVIESKLDKYINYSLSEQDKGTLVQYEIKSRIEYGKEVIPVNHKETIVSLDQIEGKYPNKVKVITQDANREQASQYDEISGVLLMQEDNQNQNEDYFVIAYYDTYTEDNLERELRSKVTAKIILEEEEDRVITEEEQYQYHVTGNIGDLTSIHSKAQEIYNGYMKSNIINGTTYTTSYSQKDQIIVSKKEAQEDIEMLISDTFVRIENNGEEESISDLENNQRLVYKNTKIKKSEIEKLLGKEGKLEITDIEGNNIITIDENTEFNADRTIVIDYENEPEAINIKTSNIQEEGILNLEHTKEIKDSMLDFQNVSVKSMIQLNGRQDIQESFCPIKEAKTTVNVNMSNTNWSNQQQNEVTFDINLNANTVKNNMFKNPCLQIEFPNQVEKVILGDSSIMYANGLELQNPTIVTSENGNLVMVVELTGEQTQYDENSLALITDVKIETSVILKKEIESTEETLKIFYSNQYTIDGSTEIGNKEIPIGIKNYQEEVMEEVNSPIFYNTASTLESMPQPLTENNDSIKLEVAPTKGSTIIKNDDTVYEGEYIKYNIKVTNTSDEDINDVKIVASIPEGVTYGELDANYYDYRQKYQYNFQENLREKQIDIGKIEAGKSIDTFYEVKINDLPEGKENQTINTDMNVFVGNEFAQSYSITNKVEPSEVQLFMNSLIDYGGWAYGVNLVSDREEEVEVNIHLPKAFSLRTITRINHIVEDPSSFVATEEDYSDTVYESEEEVLPGEEPIRQLDLRISDDNIITTKLQTNCYYEFQVQIHKSDLDQSVNKSAIELTSYIEAILDGKQYISNENRVEIAYQNVKVSMTSPNEGEKVQYEQPIDYEITIQNIGGSNVLATNSPDNISIKLSDFLPKELNPVKVTYDNWEMKSDETGKNTFEKIEDVTKKISGKYTDSNGNKLPDVDIRIVIPKGETAKVKIETTAGFVEKETKIENNATVTGNQIAIKTTNTIAHTILPYDYDEEEPDDPNTPNEPDEPDDPDNLDNPEGSEEPSENSYSISGIAWIDENQDGERSSEESVVNGMTVMLMDIADANTIKSTAKTNHDGRYEFSDIKKGNYLVAFKYDTNNYQLTEYQKSGVSSSNNSDAINKTINLSGKQVEVGITDAIQLSKSVSNIDIGLIENKLCDFKIDKYINKVTVKTVKGTKEYNYGNKTLAKTEIRAKEIEGATVTIQYKIVITNEGEAAGTINQIVDYLPDELSFSTTQNSNWSKNTKGELVNTSISNRKIEAGESIELTLIATKQMTANTTGTFSNKVSIIGTMDTNEGNNTANADIIISVSTGAIVYIAIIIFTIIVLSVIVVYLYKKGKINSKNINKMTFLAIFMVVTLYSSSNVFGDYRDAQYFLYKGNHLFTGGPTGTGWCTNHTKTARGENLLYTFRRFASGNNALDNSNDFGATETQYRNEKESIEGEFDLSRRGSRDILYVKTIEESKIVNKKTVKTNWEIYGPFTYDCTGGDNVTISWNVTNNNNSTVSKSNVKICNVNGVTASSQSLSGGSSKTFYIKIKEGNGLKKIKVTAKRKSKKENNKRSMGKTDL